VELEGVTRPQATGKSFIKKKHTLKNAWVPRGRPGAKSPLFSMSEGAKGRKKAKKPSGGLKWKNHEVHTNKTTDDKKKGGGRSSGAWGGTQGKKKSIATKGCEKKGAGS